MGLIFYLFFVLFAIPGKPDKIDVGLIVDEGITEADKEVKESAKD